MDTRPPTPDGLKQKDLMGIPWRLAFALQADGWYLRMDTVWAKGLSLCPEYSGSSMPESTRDRPSKAHEYLFLFAHPDSGGRYFYDQFSVREKAESVFHGSARPRPGIDVNGGNQGEGLTNVPTKLPGRNMRSVWVVNPGNFAEAHFAVMPERLVTPCIKAGTSERGCCDKCGAPWTRKVGREAVHMKGEGLVLGDNHQPAGRTRSRTNPPSSLQWTKGWDPTCSCGGGSVPCTVLDPFGGSGTVGVVADRLGRNAVLVELNEDYVSMARRRIGPQIGILTLAPGP